ATLVEVLKAPNLKAYDDLDTLYDKRDEVWQAVNTQTKNWARADLMDAMLAVDIWCAEVKDIREAANDPQVTHLGLIASYQHPNVGEVKTVAPAVKLSETPPAIDRPAPTIGQHGREILREYGVDDTEIESLIEAGAVTIQEQAA
ncbi:MAG: CoA transferase, partial [Pseudomonadota bacterium]